MLITYKQVSAIQSFGFFPKKIITIIVTIFYVKCDSLHRHFLKDICIVLCITFCNLNVSTFLLIHLVLRSSAYLHQFQQSTSQHPDYHGLQIASPFYNILFIICNLIRKPFSLHRLTTQQTSNFLYLCLKFLLIQASRGCSRNVKFLGGKTSLIFVNLACKVSGWQVAFPQNTHFTVKSRQNALHDV